MIDDGFLVFMEENQCVVFWGISVDQVSDRDPAVFIGVNRHEEGIEWHPEHDSCHEFLNTMLVWHASYGGAAKSCAVGHGDEFAMRQWLDQQCQLVGEVNDTRAYRHEYGSMSFLYKDDFVTKMRKVSPWQVYAAATSASNMKLLRSSFDVTWVDWPDDT